MKMKLLYFFAICLIPIAHARPDDGFEFQIGYQAKDQNRPNRAAGARRITFEICTGVDQCCEVPIHITGDTFTRYRRAGGRVCKDLTIDSSHPPFPTVEIKSTEIELKDPDIGYIVIEDKNNNKYLVTFDEKTGTGVRTMTKPENADCQFGEWSAWSKCSANCGGFGRQNRTRTVKNRAFYYTDDDGISVAGKLCKGPLTRTQPCNTQPCKGYRLQAKFSKQYPAGIDNDKSIDICIEGGRCCEVALGAGEFFAIGNVCEELDTLFLTTPPTVEVKVENSENSENGFMVEEVTLEDAKREFEAKWTDVQYETTSPTNGFDRETLLVND